MSQPITKAISTSLSLLVVLGLAFYWYSLKPMNIRRDCANKIEDQVKKSTEPVTPGAMNGLFLHCLHRNGLAE